MTISGLSNAGLRRAIQQQMVSFPAQIPSLSKPVAGDLESRMVQLYFLRNWKLEDIAKRHDLTAWRVRQVLTAWRHRAIASGYIQEVRPEDLSLLEPEAEAAEAADASEKLSSAVPRPAPLSDGGFAPLSRNVSALQHFRDHNDASLHTGVLSLVLEELESHVRTAMESADVETAIRCAFCEALCVLVVQVCLRLKLDLLAAQLTGVQSAIARRDQNVARLIHELNTRLSADSGNGAAASVSH